MQALRSFGKAKEDAGKREGENFLYDYKFMINLQTRLWEVQLTTINATNVLSEMF